MWTHGCTVSMGTHALSLTQTLPQECSQITIIIRYVLGVRQQQALCVKITFNTTLSQQVEVPVLILYFLQSLKSRAISTAVYKLSHMELSDCRSVFWPHAQYFHGGVQTTSG